SSAPVELAAETQVEDILATLSQGAPPRLVVIDSIQTMWTQEVEAAPGTVTQVRGSAQALIRYAKTSGACLILVGHVTKDGQIAGPRVVEHMVDAVASFEGDGARHFRVLRAVKNRFGPTDEIGVFEMTGRGLAEVANPSALFLAGRDANAAGTRITAQVMGRPVGLMFGWELSQHPFLTREAFREVAHLPLPERIAALRDPARRARILAEPTHDAGLRARLNNYARIYRLTMDYEPPPEASVAATAAREGRAPEDLCYDWMLEHDGQAILNRPLLNYADGHLDTIREMMTHPHTLMGLGDGGAHVGYICDASAPTHMLTHWSRDRAHGRLPLEFAVKRISGDNAAALGLHDRGVLAAGRRADINIIDIDRLALHRPSMRYDLPAGGKRLVQGADGYVATIVAGEVVRREGVATGARPGRLVKA
ncbi:MAG: amidohydrolase family protein, partial [Alphaproteobacteria bacterium]|nr:amidohydrolase family protein [Alphaproteobacteria bacterium]